MTLRARTAQARNFLAREWQHLARVNASSRPWELPLAAALANGLPIMVGAATGHLGQGLVASMGGLAMLYLPATPLAHRMAWMMACAFGLSAAYALGIVSSVYEPLTIPVLGVIAAVVTMVCRFYAVPPPGSLFFVMAAAIGAYAPAGAFEALRQVGLVTMGTVLALGVAFIYSLYALRKWGPAPTAAPAPSGFDVVVVESLVIGAFVALSLAAAQLLRLDRPYWVPVSCLAVIQGVSLRAVWVRQFHRIAGTAAGLLLLGLIAMLPLSDWGLALLLTGLVFVIELLVVRHYGLATVFVTPLAILLAEGTHLVLGDGLPVALMQARLMDTVVGCVAGLAGGIVLHNERVMGAVSAALRGVLGQRI